VDLKIASQKAKDATDAAEAARRTMNEFDAMSRDVRKPASSIIAMTKLLLDTDLTDQQRRYAENMRANGESLLMLIDNLLESDSD
jgi:signal transduction histidine kinase